MWLCGHAGAESVGLVRAVGSFLRTDGLTVGGVAATRQGEKRTWTEALNLWLADQGYFPDDFYSHMGVLAAFGIAWGPEPEIETPIEVRPGVAVCYQEDVTVKEEWVIIEDLLNPKQSLGEYGLDHPIARSMMGKRVNESFVLRSNQFQETTATILDIQSKYIYRFNDCFFKMDERFPEKAPIFKVALKKTEHDALDLTPLLQSVDQKHDSVQSALETYRENLLPFHQLGVVIGCSVFDLVRILASIEDAPVRCCQGNQQEYADTLSSLRTAKTLVLDESALATLFLLHDYQYLFEVPFECIVSEGTLQSISDVLFLRMQSDRNTGFLTKIDGKYVFIRHTKEELEERRRLLETFLSVIKKACTIKPGTALASFSKPDREQLIDLFGQAAAESVALAKANGSVLWTDDLTVGGVAATMQGVKRTWTQALTLWLADQGYVPNDCYLLTSTKLLKYGYFWTQVNTPMVMFAADKAKWKPKNDLLSYVVSHFGNPEANLTGLGMLTIQVLGQVWNIAPDGNSAQYLVSCILDKIATRKGGGWIISLIYNAANRLMNMHPKNAEKLRLVIATWFDNMQKSGFTIG